MNHVYHDLLLDVIWFCFQMFLSVPTPRNAASRMLLPKVKASFRGKSELWNYVTIHWT